MTQLATDRRILRMGRCELQLGSRYLDLLQDANADLNDVEMLRQRLHRDGYLLLRGLQRPERVLAAREAVLRSLQESGALDPDATFLDGVIGGRNKGKLDEGASVSEVKALTESPEIFDFFERLLGRKAATYDRKWLRVIGNGHSTNAHYDVVYMGRGSIDRKSVV